MRRDSKQQKSVSEATKHTCRVPSIQSSNTFLTLLVIFQLLCMSVVMLWLSTPRKIRAGNMFVERPDVEQMDGKRKHSISGLGLNYGRKRGYLPFKILKVCRKVPNFLHLIHQKIC